MNENTTDKKDDVEGLKKYAIKASLDAAFNIGVEASIAVIKNYHGFDGVYGAEHNLNEIIYQLEQLKNKKE